MWRRVLLTAAAERIRVIEDNDLTVTQFKALLLLAEQGRQSGGQIAELLGLSPAAASRALDAMVQRGLATRTECEDDRRIRLFEATEAGLNLTAGMADLRKAQIERYLETIDGDALDGLVAALGPLGLDDQLPDGDRNPVEVDG
jgi:DNA-binding MarR family transcriptional regulator